jgi:1-acyl-sn-glycerol-3-phosphate acyltransferase
VGNAEAQRPAEITLNDAQPSDEARVTKILESPKIAQDDMGQISTRGARSSPQSPAPSPLLSAAARAWYSTLYGPCFAISKALFRFRFAGKPNVPIEGPVLIVSNHQSNLDPVLIGLACPRQLKYFARVGLFFWPFSWWIRALGAVPIDKENAIGGIKTTLKLLKQGEAVVVFPEGSRTHDGTMNEMLPGFCMLARRAGATIVPVAIDGAFNALPRGSALPRLTEITLVICPQIPPNEIATMTDEELTRVVENRIRTARRNGIFGEQASAVAAE